MKIRRLPDTDLARISPLPVAQQRTELENFRLGRPRYSYRPLRENFADVFNLSPEMFGTTSPTDWEILKKLIVRKCKNADEIDANLQVARGLHHFASSSNLTGRSYEIAPLRLGVGQSASFWLDMVLVLDERPFIPFLDPRRSKGLTALGRKFAFSMMREHILATEPDLAEINFAIIQFEKAEDGLRAPRFHFDTELEPLGMAELEAMVATTYEIWREVSEQREADARRRGTGTTGPLI